MFIKGKSYIRRELHNRYGGQQQGGISTPADYPVIFLFTGAQGEEYGYRDSWTEEGVFLYTGEGQRGDMEFVRGNKAIRDHIENGKDLYLFEYVDEGVVRYVDQMICSGFEFREAPDVEENFRRAFVFHLIPEDSFDPSISAQDNEGFEDMATLSMDELRQRALGEEGSPRQPRESLNSAYDRSEAVKAYVMLRASGVCEACGNEAPFTTAAGRPFLETHHVRSLSDGGPDHPAWVAGVCPNCHRRAHFGSDREVFNCMIRENVVEKEHELGYVI